jgi:hypothetical protein
MLPFIISSKLRRLVIHVPVIALLTDHVFDSCTHIRAFRHHLE